MIDHKKMLSIIDTPVSLRTPSESSSLKQYFDQFPNERKAANKMEATLACFKMTASLEPSSDFNARLRSSLASEAKVKDRSNRPRATAGLFGHWIQKCRSNWAAPSLIALCLAGLVFGLQTHQGPDVRSKGFVETASIQSVDLQFVVESTDPQVPIQAGLDGDLLKKGDGILFRMVIQGEGELILIERDPRHYLRRIYTTPVVNSGPKALEISILGEGGLPLRYVPDGPPGEYTYIATLLDPGKALDDSELDRIWSLWVDSQGIESKELRIADPRMDGLRLRYFPEGTSTPGEHSPSTQGSNDR